MKTWKIAAGVSFWCSVMILLLATPLYAEVRFSTTSVEVPATCQAYACGDNAEACKACHLIADSPSGDATGGAQTFMSLNIMMAATSSPTTTVTSPDGKVTVTYPPTVAVGESFTNDVTVNGYAMMYDYFVDGTWFAGAWPWFRYNYTYSHSHTFDAPARHTFTAKVLYCDGGWAICGHGWLRTEVSWDVTVGTPLLVIDNVPYYNQGSITCDDYYASHPNETRKAEPCVGGGPWASDIYDHYVSAWENVQKWGCAITSAVMVIRKLGVDNVCYDNNFVPCSGNAFDNAANWHDVNPRTLNQWAKARRNDGYTNTGAFKFERVFEYTNRQIEMYKRIDSRNDNVLNLAIALKLPPVLSLRYYNPSDRRTHEHRVVATGQAIDGGRSTWSINDPGHFVVENLLSCYYNTRGARICYDNTYFNLRVFRPTIPSEGYSSLAIYLASPAEFLVTDPAGRRAGFDPVSGTVVNEIPDFEYGTDRIDDAEGEDLGPEVKSFYIARPLPGRYDVRVVGTGSGEFDLSVTALDNAANETSNAFVGTIAPSRTYDYRIDYSVDENFPTIVTAANYQFLGFQPPIQTDGSRVFRFGSTVPVKFQVRRIDGALAADVTARLTLQKYSDGAPLGEPIDASPTGGPDIGNLFRYDVASDQYIYNLSTGTLSLGTWKLIATLDDGTAYEVSIGLK